MKTIHEILEEYLQNKDLSKTHLVLDSTGPSLTKHYLALDAIGDERLSQFKRIHTFSGGTFAYFGYKAAKINQCRYPMDEYYKNLDRTMRKNHSGRIPLIPQALRYARQKKFYKSLQPMEETIRYVFSESDLSAKLSEIDSNFSAYMGSNKHFHEVSRSNPIEGVETVFDLIKYSVNIPFMYGGDHPYHDPAFHRGYRRKLKEIAHNSENALVITPWRSGIKNNTLFLNPFLPAKQKWVMSRDIICLLANIPNPSYARDLRAIFSVKE